MNHEWQADGERGQYLDHCDFHRHRRDAGGDLVYSSILNRETYSTLREEATVLSDNADYQILETIRNEPARRMAMKSGLTETVQAVSRKGEAGSMEIQTLSNGCAAVCAAIPSCDRLGLYFPRMQMVVGSDGVHFLDDKKYTVRESQYVFLNDAEERRGCGSTFPKTARTCPTSCTCAQCPAFSRRAKRP